MNSITSDSEENSRIEMKDASGESVIMDINPSKFEKPKDHLFFDFFSLYTKNFIDGKNPKKYSRSRSQL